MLVIRNFFCKITAKKNILQEKNGLFFGGVTILKCGVFN